VYEALSGKRIQKGVLFLDSEAADGGCHIRVYIPCEVKKVFASHANRKKENRELLVVSVLLG
jgi:hypothetical protein